ncbi:MAG: type IV pilus modification PilV family protein [Telluria sp.]
MSTRRRGDGFTLIETVITIVVISVALVGVLTILGTGSTRSVNPLRRAQAIMIAEGLLDEVQLQPFTTCDPHDTGVDTGTCATYTEGWGPETPDSAAGRPYDNVNDYVSADGATNSTVFGTGGVLTDAAGNVLGGVGYNASVKIQAEAFNGIPSSDALHITVTVTYDNDSVVLEAIRTKYAPTL